MKDKLIRISVVLALMLFGFFIYCVNCHADEIDDILPFLITVESGGNPNAVSSAGAVGLCQITPIVFKEWKEYCYRRESFFPGYYVPGLEDLFNPKYNIEIATWYLRRLRDHYLKENYTLNRLLCAWNGGITRLRAVGYDCSKMPKESRDFSRKVMGLYEKSLSNL